MTVFRVQFHTPTDKLGRRQFTMRWEEPEGVYRPEPSKQDGLPVGYRRGQVFFAVPEPHFEQLRARGHTVVIEEES